MKRSTIAKDFEAKQAIAGNDRSVSAEPPAAPALGGTTSSLGSSVAGGGQYASQEEVGELRQAIAMKVNYNYLGSRANCERTLFV